VIYIKPNWKVSPDSDRVYHTKQCYHYEKADPDVFREITEDEIPEDSRECKVCAGTAKTSHMGKEWHSLTAKIASEDFGPEDAGLSKMGER